MSSWARVGAKCVRVPSSGEQKVVPGSVFRDGVVVPKYGVVYTVVGTMWCDTYQCLRIMVRGAPNPDWAGRDAGWGVECFKPLITKSQEDDISMFKSLLKPTEVPA